MKIKRIFLCVISFILAFVPFLFSPQNLVFAESGVTVSDYNGLKNALLNKSNTLIKLNPGIYELDEPLIINHKVRLVGMTNLAAGEKLSTNDTIFNPSKNAIITGVGEHNIVVNASAVLDNLTLTQMHSNPVNMDDFYSIFATEFKAWFGKDISAYKNYIIENGLGALSEARINELSDDMRIKYQQWMELLVSVGYKDAVNDNNYLEPKQELYNAFDNTLFQLVNYGPLRINNGTVQNCRVVNNDSKSKSIVMLHGGTFFGNLVALNTVHSEFEDDLINITPVVYIRGNDNNNNNNLVFASAPASDLDIWQRYTGYDAVIKENGLSFILNNTVACNKYLRDGNQEEAGLDAISLYNQSFVVNNIVYNSGNYGIYNNGDVSQVTSYNACEKGCRWAVIAENNLQLTGSPFVEEFQQQLDDSEMSFDFSLKNSSDLLNLSEGGQDIFFDKIPKDMNGVSRLSGGSVSMGAYQVDFGSEPNYLVWDAMYVSKTGSDENDGSSSWENAMASPEQAIISAARHKCKNLLIGSGSYDIEGRVLFYIQKDGFSGGMWGGMVLPEGLKVYGGLRANQSGTVEEQIANRTHESDQWDFGDNSTILKGKCLIDVRDDEDEEEPNLISNPDYLGLRENPDWTDPSFNANKPKYLTMAVAGVRVITQVENFSADSNTTIDGLNITDGYVVSRKESEPSWPEVKRVNCLGGAGVLIRNGTTFRNNIVSGSYESSLFGSVRPSEDQDQVYCGGGIMVSGGLVSNCHIKDNISESSGGGIFLVSGRVENSLVENNMAFNMGGGIVTSYFSILNPASIFHTTIKNNSAMGIVPPETNRFSVPYPTNPNNGKGIGGGAWIGNNVTADGLIVEGNLSKNGGDGIYVGTVNSKVAQAVVQNSLITKHTDSNNSAVVMEAGSLYDSNIIKNNKPIAITKNSTANIRGTVFWDNTEPIPAGLNITYSATPEGYGVNTAMNLSLSSDNSNISGPNFENPDAGNYHLLLASPLINRNSPEDIVDHDYDMVSRPRSGVSDIGMFEHPNEITVRFEGNGGTYSDNSSSIDKNVLPKSKLEDIKPDNPVKSGSVFVGYTTVKDDFSTKIDDEFLFEESTTVYAYYTSQNVQKTGDDSNLKNIIIVCVIIAVASLGIYLILRKKSLNKVD